VRLQRLIGAVAILVAGSAVRLCLAQEVVFNPLNPLALLHQAGVLHLLRRDSEVSTSLRVEREVACDDGLRRLVLA
jgi:hypothetical protein